MRTPSFLALLVLMTSACRGADRFRPLRVGDPAPDYAAVSVQGDTVSLQELSGSPVLLDVWATWCIPCGHEMPALQALSEQYADSGLRVLGVSIDAAGTDARVAGFVAEHGIRFTILRDPDRRVEQTFRTIGVPETFLLDRQGRVAHRWIGEFDPAAPAVRQVLHAAVTGGR